MTTPPRFTFLAVVTCPLLLGCGGPETSQANNAQANVSNTRTFGPSAVNELRLNYTRNALRLGAASGSGLGTVSSFGFQDF